MNRFFQQILAFSFLSILPCAALAQNSPLDAAPVPEAISVLLYNYAHIPTDPLAQAEAEASRILREAGVKMTWSDCPLTAADGREKAACEQSQGPADLVIRILPRAMAERVKKFKGFYGFAWPAPAGSFARVASVFHHQVQRLARDGGFPEGVLLGHLIAHEVGHLLLGLGSHSPAGLMRHPWRPQELNKALRGRLVFNARQRREVRDNVRDRIQAQIASR